MLVEAARSPWKKRGRDLRDSIRSARYSSRPAGQGITLAEFEKNAGGNVPLRHLPALAEVADAAVLLASDLSRGMTSTFANVTCGAQTD